MDITTESLGEVRVFGTFGLFAPDGRSVRLAARSAATLVAYLALHRKGVSRSEVADALWPEGDPDRARAALRTAVRRARLGLGGEAIVDEGGRLRLTLDADTARAERYRRRRRHASDIETAATAARAEWEIVRHALLQGWEDAWVLPLRDDARMVAHECGGAYARLLEERGEPEAALGVLDGVLEATPYQAEALEQAMRLEASLNGRESALARVADARRNLLHDDRLGFPESIRQLERTIREGGFLPPPCGFADGQELSLIGHMFEADLKRGGRAALETLAQGAFDPVCLRHPYKTLDLLRKAIALSEGTNPQRSAVIAAAVQYAQYVGDDDALHELCDGLIAAFPKEHPFHNGSLTVKGGAYLEARDFARARRFAELAVEGCVTEERRMVALAQVALIDGHEGRLDSAIATLLATVESLRRSSREDRDRNEAAIHQALCEFHAARGDWASAVASGFVAQGFRTAAPATAIAVAAPLGLALVVEGRRREGATALGRALADSHAERMPRAFAFALDATAGALARMGEPHVAKSVLDAANAGRRRLGFPRSPSELQTLAAGGLDPSAVSPGPLRLQSSGTLAEWLAETLQRIAR